MSVKIDYTFVCDICKAKEVFSYKHYTVASASLTLGNIKSVAPLGFDACPQCLEEIGLHARNMAGLRQEIEP